VTVRARPLPALLALVLVAVLLLGPGASSALGLPVVQVPAGVPAGEPVEAETDEPFTVTVDTLTPAAPRPEDTVVVAGRITAAEPLTDISARLRVGRPLTSRSALARADTTLLPTSTRGETAPVADAVPAGTTRAFQLVVPASELRLEDLGVHPLHVEVQARVSLDGTDGHVDGAVASRTVQTFLPTFPEPVQPTRLAVLLPLTRPPALEDARGVDLVTDLAPELEPGGRLHGLLEGGAAAVAAGVPVTWVVDPALLDAVRVLAAAAPPDEPGAPPGTGSGAEVAADAGSGAPGGTDGDDPGPAGGDAARSGRAAALWLERARAVLREGAVLALPYADPDVVALLRGGLVEELAFADAAGRELVRDVLGVAPLTGWAWPPDGLATPESLVARVERGARRLLLDSATVERTVPARTTPDARTRIRVAGRELPLLTTDTGLTALLAAEAEGPEERPVGAGAVGDTLAVQRIAAETALLTAERPGSSRAVVLAPPRLWSADASYVRQLLTGLADRSWLEPVPLTDLVDGPALDGEPVELTDTAVLALRERALPEAWVRPLAVARRSLAEFAPVLTEPDPLVTPRRLALLRGASAAWRAPDLRAVGREVAAGAVEAVTALVSAVRVEGGGPVLFTAETGTIPLTVVNELGQAVVVQVAVDPAGQARLLSGAVTEVEIEPGRRRQVDVRVAARTSGQFPVLVRLRSPEGVPLGVAARVPVRSTAYGRVAMTITVGAAAVLVAASGVRLLRRAWRRHRQSPA
jgi:hypothetical protein